MNPFLWTLVMAAIPVREGVLTEPEPGLAGGARLGLEVSVGPYRPNIDDEFESETPFSDIFGTDSSLMYRLRGHYFFDTRFGQLGMTVGVGYFSDSANALAEDGNPSGGQTSLRLVPVSLGGRWRYDGFEAWSGFPITLTLGTGLNYTFWSIFRGDDNLARSDGLTGNGGSLSVELQAGLGLRLGRLDRRASTVLSREFGIEDLELGVSVLHITQPIGWWDSLFVGDTTWQANLTVLF